MSLLYVHFYFLQSFSFFIFGALCWSEILGILDGLGIFGLEHSTTYLIPVSVQTISSHEKLLCWWYSLHSCFK